ncbi:hypothetical protein ACFE04_019654 [Oxalis oulophora]
MPGNEADATTDTEKDKDFISIDGKKRSSFLLCPIPKALKKIRGNLPSEKSYHGSLDLYWQSLLSSGVRSPINSIDSVQRKGSCPSITSFIPPGIIQFHKLQLQFADRVATTSRGEFAPNGSNEPDRERERILFSTAAGGVGPSSVWKEASLDEKEDATKGKSETCLFLLKEREEDHGSSTGPIDRGAREWSKRKTS